MIYWSQLEKMGVNTIIQAKYAVDKMANKMIISNSNLNSNLPVKDI